MMGRISRAVKIMLAAACLLAAACGSVQPSGSGTLAATHAPPVKAAPIELTRTAEALLASQPTRPVKPPLASPTPRAEPTRPQVTAEPPALPQPFSRPERPLQIGLNFIRFYWSNQVNALDTTTSYLQPETIFADFRTLNIQAYRQFVKADLLWNIIEPQDNQWNFAQADAVLVNAEFEPVVNLFAMQYASPTPPWAKTPGEFQKEMGLEATDYLTTVVQRYAPYVRYWEIGNEMVYWRAADPGSNLTAQRGEKLPAAYPLDGYSPQEQGIFLAQAAAIIRQNDPDAVIVMPGLPGLDDYDVQTWFRGVLESGGKDWFDIVNYHYYGGWQPFTVLRPKFTAALKTYGLADRPVWCTETGTSANPALTIRTDYPNSQEEQAADVFRRIVSAWGMGDSLVMWHTYIGNSETEGNWSGYGLMTETAEPKPALETFRLLTGELLPYASVELLSADARGLNSYKIIRQDGEVRHVVWGKGSWMAPEGVSQMAAVTPGANGIAWQVVEPGQKIALSSTPLLLK